MDIEEKNQLIYGYISNLFNQINNKYGNVIDSNQFNNIFNLYINSNKEIEEIQREIDKIMNDLLNAYLKDKYAQIENQQQLVEKVQQVKSFDENLNINDKNELLNFYSKMCKKLYNKNISWGQLDSLLSQKFPNLSEIQRLSILYSDLKGNLSNEEKNKVFKLFCRMNNNIKSEDDFLNLCQNSKLINQNLLVQEEKLNQSGNLITISANPELGFNYSFMIYIPNGLDMEQSNNLLLHSCNTPYAMIDYNKVEEYTKVNQISDDGLHIQMANEGKIPLIIPIIPRFRGYNPNYIEDGKQKSNLETFIKMQSELDPKYRMTKDQIVNEYSKSQNILEQQINMCNYAISYLRKMGITMGDRIKVEGHSVGSKNAASLVNQYPERIVKNNGFFIGGTTGRVEVNDKTISGVIYNGGLDINNPAEFYIDKDGIPRAKYKEEYSDEYMVEEQKKYNEALEEWKKENPSSNIKEFDIVKYNIKKQHEKESQIPGRKSILVENYGHNAINSYEVRQAGIEFSKERENIKISDISQSTNVEPSMTSKRMKEKELNESKPMKMTDTEKRVYILLNQKRNAKIEQGKQKKNKPNTMTYKKSITESKGFVNILFASIIILVVVIIYFVLVK